MVIHIVTLNLNHILEALVSFTEIPCHLQKEMIYVAPKKGLFEFLWFDITCSEKTTQKSTFGIIYRHEGPATIPTFTSKMENVINKLVREKANFYIFGDYNINLLKTDEKYNISEFVNSMHSHNALNMINKPTRFPIGNQNGSPSLLDHIWTNQPTHVNSIDLIVHPISDHRPTLAILNVNTSKRRHIPNNYFVRDMANFNAEAFNESLFNFSASNLWDHNTDIDTKFTDLQTHIKNCIDLHAPPRKRTRKELKFSAKPWISKCLQISINNKNNLYHYLQTHNDPVLKRKYNKMKKILKKVCFAAETNYYEHLFDLCQKNSKKTWNLINEITCRKKRDKNSILAMKTANGRTTNDAKVIANTLNIFFTNIGTNMSNRLPTSAVSHHHFLKNRQSSSFYLIPTDPIQISEKLKSFSSKKNT